MSATIESQLLDLTRQLLRTIAEKNWDAYAALCDPSLTCFEPEAMGQLVEGMDFHKFYFDLPGASGPRNTTLASPNVRLIGESVAIVSFVRLIQKSDSAGCLTTIPFEETRIWQRIGGQWKHVHFHRSMPTHPA
jgi:calcium/calmodulin-dependent protein kinase (CaM kinase) II